jgi:hypothetical protein
MERKEIKKELRKMLEIEKQILDALASGEGTEKEQIFVCSKMFEVAEYIMSLKNYLEATRGND